jgi:hypothetical protein
LLPSVSIITIPHQMWPHATIQPSRTLFTCNHGHSTEDARIFVAIALFSQSRSNHFVRISAHRGNQLGHTRHGQTVHGGERCIARCAPSEVIVFCHTHFESLVQHELKHALADAEIGRTHALEE